jgi:hypothetical protein
VPKEDLSCAPGGGGHAANVAALVLEPYGKAEHPKAGVQNSPFSDLTILGPLSDLSRTSVVRLALVVSSRNAKNGFG